MVGAANGAVVGWNRDKETVLVFMVEGTVFDTAGVYIAGVVVGVYRGDVRGAQLVLGDDEPLCEFFFACFVFCGFYIFFVFAVARGGRSWALHFVCVCVCVRQLSAMMLKKRERSDEEGEEVVSFLFLFFIYIF